MDEEKGHEVTLSAGTSEKGGSFSETSKEKMDLVCFPGVMPGE